MQDILVSACNKKFTEKTKTLVTKGLAVGYGIISYIFVFGIKYLPGVLEVCNNWNFVFSNNSKYLKIIITYVPKLF